MVTKVEFFELEKKLRVKGHSPESGESESAVYFSRALAQVARNPQISQKKCFLYRKSTVLGHLCRIFSDYFVNFGQLPLTHDKKGPQIRILLTQEKVPIPVAFFLAQKNRLLTLSLCKEGGVQ